MPRQEVLAGSRAVWSHGFKFIHQYMIYTHPVFHPLGQGIRWLNVRFDAGQAWAMAIFAALVVGYSV
jgi:hypothetical protein